LFADNKLEGIDLLGLRDELHIDVLVSAQIHPGFQHKLLHGGQTFFKLEVLESANQHIEKEMMNTNLMITGSFIPGRETWFLR
jgi:hypothetical protein